jgi:hypothetical protein
MVEDDKRATFMTVGTRKASQLAGTVRASVDDPSDSVERHQKKGACTSIRPATKRNAIGPFHDADIRGAGPRLV